jgi:hypothetical protein
MMDRRLRLISERVDLLAGVRGAAADLDLRAVRHRDVKGLAQLKAGSALAASDPPTKAEHDALVADVHKIIAALVLLGGG